MTTKEEMNLWAKESKKILKQYGYLKGKSFVWVCVVGILWLGTIGVFYYMGTQDTFKPIVDQVVSVEPQIDVEPVINNEYDINCPVDNVNNFTIYNNIIVPEGGCE